MKLKSITQIQLANLSGVPLQTLRGIFSGKTPHPRIDTMQAIESALGLSKESNTDDIERYSDEEKRLIAEYRELNPQGKKLILDSIATLRATAGVEVQNKIS